MYRGKRRAKGIQLRLNLSQKERPMVARMRDTNTDDSSSDSEDGYTMILTRSRARKEAAGKNL